HVVRRLRGHHLVHRGRARAERPYAPVQLGRRKRSDRRGAERGVDPEVGDDSAATGGERSVESTQKVGIPAKSTECGEPGPGRARATLAGDVRPVAADRTAAGPG